VGLFKIETMYEFISSFLISFFFLVNQFCYDLLELIISTKYISEVIIKTWFPFEKWMTYMILCEHQLISYFLASNIIPLFKVNTMIIFESI
jgi:hypothetical protein